MPLSIGNYAHIPNHLIVCNGCPNDVKKALKEKKADHIILKHTLPKGSQKAVSFVKCHFLTTECFTSHAMSLDRNLSSFLVFSGSGCTAVPCKTMVARLELWPTLCTDGKQEMGKLAEAKGNRNHLRKLLPLRLFRKCSRRFGTD